MEKASEEVSIILKHLAGRTGTVHLGEETCQYSIGWYFLERYRIYTHVICSLLRRVLDFPDVCLYKPLSGRKSQI